MQKAASLYISLFRVILHKKETPALGHLKIWTHSFWCLMYEFSWQMISRGGESSPSMRTWAQCTCSVVTFFFQFCSSSTSVFFPTLSIVLPVRKSRQSTLPPNGVSLQDVKKLTWWGSYCLKLCGKACKFILFLLICLHHKKERWLLKGQCQFCNWTDDILYLEHKTIHWEYGIVKPWEPCADFPHLKACASKIREFQVKWGLCSVDHHEGVSCNIVNEESLEDFIVVFLSLANKAHSDHRSVEE